MTTDDPTRRHWTVTNPRYTWDRTVHSALTVFRRSIAEGRFTFREDHLGRNHPKMRMRERGISMAEMLECVRLGQPCTIVVSRGWIGGAYLLEDVVVLVEAEWPPNSRFSDLVPEIVTVYRTEHLAPSPLTAPLGELACLRGDARPESERARC